MKDKNKTTILELDLECEKCRKRQTFIFGGSEKEMDKKNDKLMNKKTKLICKFCGKEDTINGEYKLMG